MTALGSSLIPMWKHQKEGYLRFRDSESFGLFFEQGTGKTLTTINILRYKFKKVNRVMKTLIFGPPIVVENWRREWRQFSRVQPSRVVSLTGPMLKRMNLFAKTVNENEDDHYIFITNYEAVLKKELFAMFKAWGPEIIVNDESHRVKNHQAKRSRLIYELSKIARHKILLTGTPILQDPMDIFSQYKIMDSTIFGKSFYEFRAKYFYDKNSGMPKQKYFPNWVIRLGAYEQLNDIVNSYSMVVKKQECLSLPPFVRQTIEVELPPSQRRPYETMKQHLIAEVEAGTCTASLALTRGLRLMQIASGYIPVVVEKDLKLEAKNVPFVDNPKAKALKELLADLTPQHKVIVWAVFKENYKTIREVCDSLGVKYVEISGERTAKQKDEAVDLFHNDADYRVLLGHPGSGGIGINLIAASYSIFYSRNFSLEYDLQAEARNYRGGSGRHARVTRIDLVAKDTIDEVVASKLAAKQSISDKILMNIIQETK